MFLSCITRQKGLKSASPSSETSPPLPQLTPQGSVAVLHVPEYEEIQDLQVTRKDSSAGQHTARIQEQSTAGESGLRADYEFTKCTAYAL